MGGEAGGCICIHRTACPTGYYFQTRSLSLLTNWWLKKNVFCFIPSFKRWWICYSCHENVIFENRLTQHAEDIITLPPFSTMSQKLGLSWLLIMKCGKAIQWSCLKLLGQCTLVLARISFYWLYKIFNSPLKQKETTASTIYQLLPRVVTHENFRENFRYFRQFSQGNFRENAKAKISFQP
jgi:hypothetical protein